jgi:hypothetical protein
MNAQVPSASALHKEAIVVDGHVHITNSVFNQGIDPWKPQLTGSTMQGQSKVGSM